MIFLGGTKVFNLQTLERRLRFLHSYRNEKQLTGIPAVSDTLRTDGGCQIWTKLGQGGQYITLRYPDMKKTLLSPRGGILGDLIFLLRGY